MADPLPLASRHRSTMENTIRGIPEVETVSQTGSAINLATETDIDAISVSIPMFLGARFSLVYTCQCHPMLPSPRNSKTVDGVSG